MRVVLDTNIIVSALIAPAGKPAAIIDAWLDGKFTLLTCAAHVDGLRATLQKPRVAELIKPHKAGRLVNQVKKVLASTSTNANNACCPIRRLRGIRFVWRVVLPSGEVMRPTRRNHAQTLSACPCGGRAPAARSCRL